ncbi:unnamed protein product [Lathyrus sativus]|nr:unnamed protein product [Lathyrus sativus]
MDLFDLPTVGSNFTWFNIAGDSMSILGWFLLSERLTEKWSLRGQFVGDKAISDHCLVTIRENFLYWGRKPFKFFSGWIDHLEFLRLVVEAWSSANITSKNMFVFKDKLKMFKAKLKLWNLKVFEKVNLDVEEAIKNLNLLDQSIKDEGVSPSPVMRERMIEAQNQVWHKLHFKEDFIRLKSRCRWIREGDINSKFFHSFIKSQFRKNGIIAIRGCDGGGCGGN